MGHPYFGEWVLMLKGASAYDEKSEAIAVNPSYSQSVQLHWGPGARDGEVVIECADSKHFNGTWAELGRKPCPGSNTQEIYEHNGPCVFIRTRITKAIIGGTITTKLQMMVG